MSRRKLKLSSLAICAVLILLFGKQAAAQNNPSAKFIIDEMARRIKANDERKIIELEFDRIHIKEDLETNARSKETVHFHGENGQMVETQVYKDESMGDRKIDLPDLIQVLSTKVFSFANPPIIYENGRSYFVINFSPKNKDSDNNSDGVIIKVAGQVAGTVVIDVVDYYVLRMDAKLTSPVKNYYYGSMGKLEVKDFTLHLEQHLIGEEEPKITVVKNAIVTVRLRGSASLLPFVGKNFFEKHIYYYENYVFRNKTP